MPAKKLRKPISRPRTATGISFDTVNWNATDCMPLNAPNSSRQMPMVQRAKFSSGTKLGTLTPNSVSPVTPKPAMAMPRTATRMAPPTHMKMGTTRLRWEIMLPPGSEARVAPICWAASTRPTAVGEFDRTKR